MGDSVDIRRRQGYVRIGNHSSVKLCHWLREKLINNRPCYKEQFYGISCHRCLQMSTADDLCNQKCLFCWRYQHWSDEANKLTDDPQMILDDSIKAQRELITGFKGDERTDMKLWKEANEPNQVAISLTGEPMLYSRLGDFISLCRERGMSTFLVTNGTLTKSMENLSTYPTQFYITAAAPDKETYEKLCVPRSPKLWDRFNESLELFSKMNCRRVIRLTLVDGWNMDNIDGYASIIDKARPDFVEVKGYVFVGDSRRRMTNQNMPSHDSITEFSRAICEATGFKKEAEVPGSRVVLLGRGGTPAKLSRV